MTIIAAILVGLGFLNIGSEIAYYLFGVAIVLILISMSISLIMLGRYGK